MTGITLITHTRNSAGTLPRLLATTGWLSERVVVDMASDDETRALAQAAGCRIVDAPVSDAVDAIRNDYLSEAKTDWTLVLDSDEALPDDAEKAVRALIRVYGATKDAFALPRFNYVAGQILRGSGWYPDHQIRLFRTGSVSWQAGHHRPPLVEGGEDRLHRVDPEGGLHIHHHNYASLAEVIEKQLHYALTDSYPDDAADFDFGDYIAEAYAEYARRFDPDSEGDLSAALATIMAWDKVVRGLLHWERLGRAPELPRSFALPVATSTATRPDRQTQDMAGPKTRASRLFRRKRDTSG